MLEVYQKFVYIKASYYVISSLDTVVQGMCVFLGARSRLGLGLGLGLGLRLTLVRIISTFVTPAPGVPWGAEQVHHLYYVA